jgi:hypothetical protein
MHGPIRQYGYVSVILLSLHSVIGFHNTVSQKTLRSKTNLFDWLTACPNKSGLKYLSSKNKIKTISKETKQRNSHKTSPDKGGQKRKPDNIQMTKKSTRLRLTVKDFKAPNIMSLFPKAPPKPTLEPFVPPKPTKSDFVDIFCRGTNAFFRELTLSPVRDYVELEPARNNMGFLNIVKTSPQYPGVARPVWLTIAASVPTFLLWYGYYKFSVEEELFQDELRRKGRVRGLGGYGTLLPFVFCFFIGFFLSTLPFADNLSNAFFEVGGAWILITQINLYKRVNELYLEQFGEEAEPPLYPWWAILPPPLDVVVGLRQVHFLSLYWANIRGENLKRDPIAEYYFPFIGSKRFTLVQFLTEPNRWFWFTSDYDKIDNLVKDSPSNTNNDYVEAELEPKIEPKLEQIARSTVEVDIKPSKVDKVGVEVEPTNRAEEKKDVPIESTLKAKPKSKRRKTGYQMFISAALKGELAGRDRLNMKEAAAVWRTMNEEDKAVYNTKAIEFQKKVEEDTVKSVNQSESSSITDKPQNIRRISLGKECTAEPATDPSAFLAHDPDSEWANEALGHYHDLE